jgi:DNA-binding response OmpR family regulator
VTQEAILADRSRRLNEVLEARPPWSDFPLLVLTPAGAQAQTGRALESIGHMMLMQRPIQIAELASAVRTAPRDRRRQYELREQFAQRERDAEALRRSESYGQDDDRRRSREAGFDHHLVKPIDHDALLALLGRPGLAL